MTNRILIIIIAIFTVLLILSVSLTVLITTTHVFSPNDPAAAGNPQPNPGENNPQVEVSQPAAEEPTGEVVSISPPADEAPAGTEPAATEPSPPETSTPVPAANTPSPAPTQAASQPTAAPNTVTNRICDLPGVYTVSLILEDSNTYEPPFGAEMIRLLRVDAQQTLVVALSSYLSVPAGSLKQEYGILESTLGSVYHTVYQRTSDVNRRHARAAQAVNDVIGEGFGVSVDFYISVDQKFLRQWITFTGPVSVNNPTAFSAGETNFPAGIIELNADNVWRYLTAVAGPADELARLDRQDAALRAMFTAVQNGKTLIDLKQWLSDQSTQIRTNLDAAQLSATLCALTFSGDALEYRLMPSDSLAITNDRILLIDPGLLADLFQ